MEKTRGQVSICSAQARRPCRRRLGRWQRHAAAIFFILQVPAILGVSFKELSFTKSRYNATIHENGVGLSYATPEEKMGIATRTTTLDFNLRYRIVSGDKEKLFRAESRQVGDFCFLSLRTRTQHIAFNRERTELYKLKIRATARFADNTDKDLDAETVVWVQVLDTNDLEPFFSQSEYEVHVPEDTPLHKSIAAVKADDADVGVNGQVYYYFAERTEQFAIHPVTGVVTLTRPLVFVENPYYELVVLANDRGHKAVHVLQPDRARVRVHVIRVNQHDPEIHVRHLPEIVEHSHVDVYAVVRVDDKDSGPNGEVASLEIISGDDDGYFVVQRSDDKPNEFSIALLKLLDRERAPHGYNLTLRASDRGVPPRSSLQTVRVSVADLNDHAPIFEKEHYAVKISETAPVNTPLLRLRVTDFDSGRNAQVQLEIVAGNEDNFFRVNPHTGVLYTALPLDAELRSEYVLTISARDQGSAGMRKQSSAKVTVTVADANDNDPLFPYPRLDVDVDENEPPGLVVTQLNARDADSGENSYVSYSIANLNAVPFEIDPFSGVLKTTETLDYETGRRKYVLKIRASDWGTPYRRQTELILVVAVRDVNDNRPQFERVGCHGKVSRATPIGTELLTLSAVDLDEGNSVSYRIVSGNEDGCFSLDPTGGTIATACDLSDLGISERYLNVTATDGQHFADIMSVHISLIGSRKRTDADLAVQTPFECRSIGLAQKLLEMGAAARRQNANAAAEESDALPQPGRYGQNVHAPEFVNWPDKVRVNESVSSGTPLVRLQAKDRDHGYNGLLVYVISNGDDDSVFAVDTETGLLRVVGQLDRERRTGYALNITAHDLGQPQRSTSRVLPVVVTDVNDNPPRFEKPVFSVEIEETAGVGLSVAQLSATDPDEGDNGRVTYQLVSDTRDFRLDATSGLLTVAAPLDRERRDAYELIVVARDNGVGATLSAKAIVRVKVLDVNDVAPRFARPLQVVKVREDIPEGSVIALMEASDPDTGPGGEIRYTLAGSFASEQIDRFAIDKLTGTVRVLRKLDYEETQIYNLTIRARDRGSPSLSSEAHLVVEVLDVNENLFPPRFEDFVAEAVVKENAAIGSFVAKVTAVDNDTLDYDSTVSYFIKGGTGFGLFSIDNQGTIRTRAILDRETQPYYWLTVVAQDHGIVPLSSSVEVFVDVLDENDHFPLTVEPIYRARVPENSPPKTPVLQINATDADLNPKEKFNFQIVGGNPQSLFEIDAATGLIRTTATGRRLDRESQAEHILEVSVSDNGSPVLSSSTRVVVTVDDVNDNNPKFVERVYKLLIYPIIVDDDPTLLAQNDAEESQVADGESAFTAETWLSSTVDELSGVPIFRVVAFDKDAGLNGELQYSVLETSETAGRFKIHPDLGIVYALRNLYAGEELNFQVKASDKGSPSRSATALVALNVASVSTESTHPPEVSMESSRRADVMESDAINHEVAVISANDADGDTLWFNITGGNDDGRFAINPMSGTVFLAAALDWELQSFYSLNISVTDGVHYVYTQLDVNVLDENDHAPVFTQPFYEAEISESADVGTQILQLNATDADQDKRVFYAWHSASSPISLRKFKIDSIRGVVSLAEKLDRETLTQHVLTVLVKDQGTPSQRNYARVIIRVTDHNDHAPEFMSEVIQIRIYETAAIGSAVTSVLAVDKDRGLNAKVSYSISSGNIGGAFVMDPDSGLIRVNQILDLNSAHEYMLVVKATDAGTPPLSSTCRVHILVTMAENDPPKFKALEYVADVPEDAATGTFVTQVESRSVSSLLYEIIDGNSEDVFLINPSSGIIITRNPLDYETKRIYNLTVKATSMVGSSALSRVLVHILDVNDNKPRFVQENYEGSILESSPVGSLVFNRRSSTPLVLSASDADSGINSMLSYEILEPSAAALFIIDSTTGAIRTQGILDREKFKTVEFTVQVSDSGRPRLMSDNVAKVRVYLIDVNDSPPQFVGTPYSAVVLVPTYPGVTVLQVSAADPDTDINSTLLYDIAGGNAEGKFQINRQNGWISLTNADGLSSFYQLEISVTDGSFTTLTQVSIQTERIESSGLAFAKDKYVGNVMENSTRASTVAVLSVLGSLLNEHVTFAILNPNGLFQIGKTSGVLSTTGLPFDRETRDAYTVIVEARSERGDGDKPRIAVTKVEVRVTDINDNRPIFVNMPYYAVVSVEAQKGDVVTKVQAIDKDINENGDIRFALVRGSGDIFRVSSKTGEITLLHSLEGHNSEYELLVSASDGGSPRLSAEATVRIKVIDRSMPVFEQQFYFSTVLENSDYFTPVVSVQANSPDGRKLIYAIIAGNENEEFGVDFNTGLIYVAGKLDYELRSKYELLVRATDSVSGVFAEVPVSINLEDANDSPPEFTHNEYNVSVSEALPFGSKILKVVAHDQDSGSNAVIRYRLASERNTSFSPENFHIDPVDGVVTLSRALDYEQNSKHHLLVIAVDQGKPALSSTSHIWIRVEDVNDNPPRFELPSYSSVLSEDAKRGQFVTMVTAMDPDTVDQSKLIYAISGGNEHQTFEIDPKKGMITLGSLHRFGEQPHYLLNISVTDGVYTSFTRLTIELLSTNRNSPQFAKNIFEAQVPENQSPGVRVTQVVASDGDRGDYGRITYAITSDLVSQTFRIDENTGEIFTREVLDREKVKSYEIPVVAMDGGGKTGHSVVQVQVTDLNDNRPRFLLSKYKANIHANATVGQPILRVQAIDADAGDFGKVVYSLYKPGSLQASELFGININTGELFLAKPANGLENQVYQFFVRAEDKGDPSLGTEVPVDIVVIEPQERPPMFEKSLNKFFVSESAAVGTTVAHITAVSSEDLTYSVVSAQGSDDTTDDTEDPDDPSKIFAIDNKGQLYLLRTLDRETAETHYISVMAATQTSPPLVALTEVVIQVMDSNEFPPEFESNPYKVTVAENAEKGTSIVRVIAHDADRVLGSHGDIRYSFGPTIGHLANLFRLESDSGWLSILAPLDREKQDHYSIPIVATDNGSPKLSSSTAVFLSIRDYNDNPPQFSQSHYATAVNEEAQAGTVVIQLSITDLDSELPSRIEFYIISGDPRSQFGVRSSGDVYVAQDLDRELTNSYDLEILATDGFFTATTHVTIDIIDDNDNPPYCGQYRYIESLSENTAVGSYILTVRASDADEGENAKMKFYLTGEGSESFSLDSNIGHLRVAKSLDRETRSKYSLVAHVQDRNKPQWECTSEIFISVSDINDNAPRFTQDLYVASIPEDANLRTLVAKVHANDDDVGVNRKLRYSFTNSADGHFAIDPESGIITVAKSLDRETVPAYNLTVMASDLGIPSLNSTSNITVSILDVNDNPPEFVQRQYFASIPENSAPGTQILTVLAISLDIGINAEVSYSIVGGNEHKKFRIDPKTGVISVAEELDYERAKEFYLTIQAVDGGSPPLSGHSVVNITITDVNDNAPIFDQLSYSAVICEDVSIGTTVTVVNAVDLDGGDNGRITYTLLQGNKYAHFRIDSSTGVVTVAGQLDRELIPSYTIEVEARDNGIPSMASLTLISITICDVNDNQPVFSQANYTAIAQEDKALGFTILKFQVSDADGPGNSGPFIFEIRAGNVENAFRIDSDGSLRTAKKFNHKVRDQYSLQIRVFDNGSPTMYSDTWVQVKVIEESKYPPVITPLEININTFLDEFSGGVLGKVQVTDQDPYDSLTFSIASPVKSPTSPALFEIDREDGTLIAKPGLDVGSYVVNVSATDGKFTTYSGIRVNVVLVSEEAVQNAIIVTIRELSAEDFILNYRKNLSKAVRNIMNIRTKDVIIISVQSQSRNRTLRETSNPWRNRDGSRGYRPNLDVLFAVQKPQAGFYPPAVLRKQLTDNLGEFEATLGHRIVGIAQGLCTASLCDNGKCYDRVHLDDSLLEVISTPISSFVSPRHSYKPTCHCKEGYSGETCSIISNECAKNPCPESFICRPEAVSPGYSCRCPEGSPGCSQKTSCHDSGSSNCYEPRHPLSFSGKSYAQYSLNTPIDRRLSLALRVRTVHPTGNIFFASGRVDYSVLEIVNGYVQFRFDCGSGEGRVLVQGLMVNDGTWHEIRVERLGNTADLTVDGIYRSHGNAPGATDLINLDTSDIFFGAEVRQIPSTSTPQGFDDIRMGFVGCLDDIRMDQILLPNYIASASVPLLQNANLATSSSALTPATLRRFTNVEFVCRVSMDRPGICGSQPCLNGGSCVEVGGLSYQCHCRPRFTGLKCEIDTNPCASSPCLYGGKCYNLNNDFRCECPSRLSGKRCEYGQHCNPNPCKNGGICEEGITGPICKCRGFTGDLCNVDINECEPNPCQNGASCLNIVGSFQCICPSNATGQYCNELATVNDLIVSGKHGITLMELIFIVAGIAVILLLALVFILCQRSRYKRRRLQPNNLVTDHSNGKELVPLNSNRSDLPEYKRSSKMSNLEVNQSPPMLPPRPASYTPSGTEPTYIPLNNLDTIRSYGSAADELETYPMLGINTYGHAHSPDYHPNLNRPLVNGAGGPIHAHSPSLPVPDGLSDTDSLHKPCWPDLESNLKGSYYEAAKIHNDLKSKSPEGSQSSYGISKRNVKPGPRDPLKKHTLTPMSSVDDCAAAARGKPAVASQNYHWDCSDWAHQSQNPLPNITEVPGSEIPDTSSFHSNESNESNNQNVNGITVNPERDLDTLVEDQRSVEGGLTSADSECGTDFELSSHDGTNPFRSYRHHPASFEQILARSGLRLSDLAVVSLADRGVDFAPSDSEGPPESLPPPPGDYVRHPNMYLPPYSIASETEAEDGPGSSALFHRDLNDLADDLDSTPSSRSSMISQISRPTANNNSSRAVPAADQVSLSMASFASRGSCSDVSNLCEIEDSEYEGENNKSLKPPMQTAV